MSTQPNDGGPAFPQTETSNGQPMHVEFTSAAGMSLRDYLAAAALQGILADSQWEVGAKNKAASIAYGFADAMLVEREKPK